MYKPALRFNTLATLLIPETQKVNGVLMKVYPNEEEGMRFYCSFRSFGGSENTVNGIYAVESTATVETWFDPRIKSDCRITCNDKVYEILGEPENINLNNQYIKFKVKLIKGGA